MLLDLKMLGRLITTLPFLDWSRGGLSDELWVGKEVKLDSATRKDLERLKDLYFKSLVSLKVFNLSEELCLNGDLLLRLTTSRCLGLPDELRDLLLSLKLLVRTKELIRELGLTFSRALLERENVITVSSRSEIGESLLGFDRSIDLLFLSWETAFLIPGAPVQFAVVSFFGDRLCLVSELGEIDFEVWLAFPGLATEDFLEVFDRDTIGLDRSLGLAFTAEFAVVFFDAFLVLVSVSTSRESASSPPPTLPLKMKLLRARRPDRREETWARGWYI